MSQHNFDEPDETGAQYRVGINNALQALASRSAGATEPSTRYAYQPWADTTTGTLKQRNAANGGWIVRDTLAETRVISRASNTILGLGDYGCTFIASGSFTQTLTAAATLGDGWHCFYRNDGSGVITLDPNGAETIDGAATLALQPGQSCRIACTGSAFKTQGLQITPLSNSLGADVPLNNTANYFDGPSVAQGTSGTWFASGTVTCKDTAGASFFAKLWDGASVLARSPWGRTV